MKKLFIALVSLQLLACMGDYQPDQIVYKKYDSKSTIGIINVMDERFTHTHRGATVLTNSDKVYSADWNLWDNMSKKFIEFSTAKSVEIIAPEWLAEERGDIYSIGWSRPELDSDFEDQLIELCNQYALDALVIFRTSYKLRSPVRYGLYTQAQLSTQKPVYAHIYGVDLDAIDCNPIGKNVTVTDTNVYSINGFNRPEDIDELPADEIAKARPIINGVSLILTYRIMAALGILDQKTMDEYGAVRQKMEQNQGETIYIRF